METGGTDWRGAETLEVFRREEYDHNESGVRAGPVSNGEGGVWPNEPRVRAGAGGQRIVGRSR